MTTSELKVKLAYLAPELKDKYYVTRIALFGSYARNDAGPDSDIDLLVDLEKVNAYKFFDLCDFLEKELGKKVDIIHNKHLPERFSARIKNELIYV
jgi:uncharacterized protein